MDTKVIDPKNLLVPWIEGHYWQAAVFPHTCWPLDPSAHQNPSLRNAAMNWLAVVIAAGWAGFASVAYLHALRVQRMMIELCNQLRKPVSTLAPRDYDG